MVDNNDMRLGVTGWLCMQQDSGSNRIHVNTNCDLIDHRNILSTSQLALVVGGDRVSYEAEMRQYSLFSPGTGSLMNRIGDPLQTLTATFAHGVGTLGRAIGLIPDPFAYDDGINSGGGEFSPP